MQVNCQCRVNGTRRSDAKSSVCDMVLAIGMNKPRKRGIRGGRKYKVQTEHVNAIGDFHDS